MARDEKHSEIRRRLAQLWVETEPSVSAYVFSAISSFQDAEDVVQQVAQEVASRFEQYDESRPFIGWALWITKSRIIDYYRKSGRDRHVFSSGLLTQMAEAQQSIQPKISQRQEALEECLKQLQGKSRKMLQLRYEDDVKPSLIAEIFNTSSGAIRVALTRVRSSLMECIRQRIQMDGGDQ